MTSPNTTSNHGYRSTRAAEATFASSDSRAMPVGGLMVHPFPAPGPLVRAAMEQLQHATVQLPVDESEWRQLTKLPRPWDPANCSGPMRAELWAWLDLVAMWVNEEHLWNVTRPGIPECWPAHPHLVHELAVLACSRYFTSFAVMPTGLEDWHRYDLSGFLERLRDRLGDACQPGRHQSRPRQERDESHAAPPARLARRQRQRDDVTRAADPAAVVLPPDGSKHARDLHAGW